MIAEFPQYIIQEGVGKNKDWAKIVYEHYYNEAKQGNYACYNCLAVIELLNHAMSDDFMDVNSDSNRRIIQLLESAINGNDINAMINLASFYMARGVYGEGVKYYELAYKNKSDVGAFSMGVVYDLGLYGYAKDCSKAISVYKESLTYHLAANDTDCGNSFPESYCGTDYTGGNTSDFAKYQREIRRAS